MIPSVATAGCSSDTHYAQHKKCFKKMCIIHKRTDSDRRNINSCSQTKYYSCNVHLIIVVQVIKCITQRWGSDPFLFLSRRGQGDETNVERCVLVPTKLLNNDLRNHFRRSYVSDSKITLVWDQKNRSKVASRSSMLRLSVVFLLFPN